MDLEVVELEGFGVVSVEVVSDKDDCDHQNHQQHHPDPHPCSVGHVHL